MALAIGVRVRWLRRSLQTGGGGSVKVKPGEEEEEKKIPVPVHQKYLNGLCTSIVGFGYLFPPWEWNLNVEFLWGHVMCKSLHTERERDVPRTHSCRAVHFCSLWE